MTHLQFPTWPRQTMSEPDPSPATAVEVHRAVCHLQVASLPDGALREAVERLLEIYQSGAPYATNY